MTPTEMYDEIAGQFPAVWPQLPEWEWVNVHDGAAPKLALIASLLERYIGTPEVVIVVHAEPGIAVMLPRASAASFIGSHILKHEIQIADCRFTRFVAVSGSGVARGWK
jgi:hypothetical protein